MLIILGGLPGVGKTTIARALAAEIGAVHLRVDTIEQAILASGAASEVADAGYRVAYALALDNLSLGLGVVADTVNPLTLTRDAWRAVAADAGVAHLDVEVVCSDPADHRRRVETRSGDIAGLVPPTWREVVERDYHPWRGEHLVVDTARLDAAACVARIRAALG